MVNHFRWVWLNWELLTGKAKADKVCQSRAKTLINSDWRIVKSGMAVK